MTDNDEKPFGFRIPGTTKRVGIRDLLAILFVIAGGIPVIIWLGSWLYHSATREQLVNGALIVIALYVVLWLRKRLDKK
jgi:Flp pilus assembly protein TadB